MNKESQCSVRTKMKMAEALKALMTTTSFDKITVSDITEKCEIHRQTFYYHFQDRYELLEWYINKELVDPFKSDFTFDNMYGKFRNMIETINANKKFYQSAFKINSSDLATYVMRKTNEEFAEIMKNLVTDNESVAESEGDEHIFSEFLGFGLAGVIISWAREGMKNSPEALTDDIMLIIENYKALVFQRIK